MTLTNHRGRATIAALALGLSLAGCRARSAAATDVPGEAQALHDAVDQLSSVMVYDIFSPPQASRVYAYASIAAYEALRQADTTYRTLAGQVNGLAPVPAAPGGDSVSLPLAGVHAFMAVGRQFTFSRARMDSLGAAMDMRFRRALPSAVYARSIAYGDTVAKHVIAWAAGDGYTRSRGLPKFTVTSAPGRWVPTPPAYMDAVEPNWGTLRPFLMDSAGQFRPAPPVPYDTARASAYMREAMEVHRTTGALTDEQRAILAFWDCNPYVMHVQGHSMFATKKITPGGHWMSIVGLAARRANLDAAASAEAYARTSMALADAFIGAWEEKFRGSTVRPETVINQYVDERWVPPLQTPPFPEYPSGHSVISTAAAEVLTSLLGDGFAFADSSEVAFGLGVRSFDSFREAAAEAAISRLYGGIHFRSGVEQGARQGKAIGEWHVKKVVTRGQHEQAVAVR